MEKIELPNPPEVIYLNIEDYMTSECEYNKAIEEEISHADN